MKEIALKVENLTKVYRLGQIGTGTISHDLNRWLDKIRGKEDRYLKVGESNDRSSTSNTNSYVNVLDDINFEIPKGEVVGIIGKNGAGKSTLLKVISQITSPTSGTIKSNGRIASLLEVGTGMHPEMSGKENVYLNGTILGMTKKEIDVKYDEIMNFAGCAKYADTPVKRYSSGMKVRLGFAVAAFLEPEILIVDEVLAVGDAEFQKKAIGKMQDISKGGGRTVLFVSHNMASIQNLCGQCIFLDKGRVLKQGKTEDIIALYINQNQNFSGAFTNDNKSKVVHQISLLDDNEQLANDLLCGSNLNFVVRLNGLLNHVDAHIGLIIKDSKGRWVTSFTTTMKVEYEDTNREEHEIAKLTLPKVNFAVGTYFVDLSISSKAEGRIEFYENVLSFNMLSSNQYGNGFEFSDYFGSVYYDGKWVINNVG
jgi:lipopolysaccharide transport system ATP-binding protein